MVSLTYDDPFEPAEVLRSHGLKATSQRRAILQVLHESRDHPSAEEVHAKLQGEHPTVSLSTVYDTLGRLEDQRIVQTLHAGDGVTRYEFNASPHVNVICRDCGSILDIPSPQLQALFRDVERRSRFALSEQHVELQGRCRDCRDNA